jgi:AcrR family transcriptional regulator
MPTPRASRVEPRSRLSRERVLLAAMAHADKGGLEAVTMRKLAEELGVAPMALYRHVANRDDLVDGIVDIVFSEFELPAAGADWKTAMRERAISVRDAMLRHRWAIGLMESRTNPGPANLRHHDAVIGCLLAAGFDMAMAAHAYSLVDSYIYGFALTKMNLPFETTTDIAEMAESMLEPFPVGEYPNLAAFITEHAMKPGYDYADEFEYGLDVLHDGRDRVGRRRSRVD